MPPTILTVALSRFAPLAVLLALLLSAGAAAAEADTGIDEQAGLPYWEIHDQGMSLRLVQRLPDQSRGFFLARGFNRDDVELVAQGCVFQTIFRNLSQDSIPAPLSYDLRDWTVRHAGHESGLKTREDWAQVWAQRNAPKSSQIAFKWGLFPTRQTYQPGDYNWGMSMIDLKPGTRFDLEVVWTQADETKSALIRDLQCADDVELEPATP